MAIRVLIGYDGSPAASAAIEVGAQLFPLAQAQVVHLWTPPFASTRLRQRLWASSQHVNAFIGAVEREGEREAERMAAMGVTLTKAAGWGAEPLLVRMYGGEGLQLAELAENNDVDLVLVGSRGLGGTQAVLGSVSDMAAHYATRPVLVVPHPLLIAEYDALAAGPVLVGYDGSTGARSALATAHRLFPTRRLLQITVDDGHLPDDMGDPSPTGDRPVTRLRVSNRPGAPGRATASALAACAREHAAAALVVGSRGRSAVREILLGSVAMATLHHAHRPVLVAPAHHRGLP